MIWVNFCTKFLGHLASGKIEEAKEMTNNFKINDDFLQISNITITKTAYNNRDIFVQCLINKSKFVFVFEINKDIGKIINIERYLIKRRLK